MRNQFAGAFVDLQQGFLRLRQARGISPALGKKCRHIIATEHLQMQQRLRHGFVVVLIAAEVADKVAGLDRHGLVQYHDAAFGFGFALCLEELEGQVTRQGPFTIGRRQSRPRRAADNAQQLAKLTVAGANPDPCSLG